MQNKLQKIQSFLEENPRREVCFFKEDSNVKLTSKLTIQKILDLGFLDLESYIQNLKAKNPQVKEVRIEKYIPNGVGRTAKVPNDSLVVAWENSENLPLGEGVPDQGAAAVSVAASTGTQSSNQKQNMMSTDSQTPIGNTMNFGMNAALKEQVSLFTKAERYEEEKAKRKKLEKKLDEIDDDWKAKYKKLELKNDDLHGELREAKSDLKTAEKFKELELLKVGLEKKPFIDPETAKIAIENFGPVLGAMLNKGQVQQASTGGLSGVEHLSDVKKALIEEIQKDEFSEDMANNLTSLYIILTSNDPGINTQIAQIIQQYNNQ